MNTAARIKSRGPWQPMPRSPNWVCTCLALRCWAIGKSLGCWCDLQAWASLVKSMAGQLPWPGGASNVEKVRWLQTLRASQETSLKRMRIWASAASCDVSLMICLGWLARSATSLWDPLGWKDCCLQSQWQMAEGFSTWSSHVVSSPYFFSMFFNVFHVRPFWIHYFIYFAPHLRNLLGSCCGNGSPRSCRHRRDFNCFRLEIADRLQRKGQFSAALFAAGVELDGIGWCMLVYFTMQAQTFNPYWELPQNLMSSVPRGSFFWNT